MKTRSGWLNRLGAGLAAVMLALGLSGCESMETREETGTLIGVLVGVAAGAAIDGRRGAVIGAMAGGLLGNRLGHYLDERERRTALAASQEAVKLPTDTPQHWEVRDEESEEVTASGWVTPTTDLYARNGRQCRDVEFVTRKDGEQHVERETLCETEQGWVTASLASGARG